MTTLGKLNQYGPVFQVKVLGALLTQRQFLINVIDSVDSEYFESSAHKWVVEYIQKYFGEYHTTPTVETLSIEVKKIENEVTAIVMQIQRSIHTYTSCCILLEGLRSRPSHRRN